MIGTAAQKVILDFKSLQAEEKQEVLKQLGEMQRQATNENEASEVESDTLAPTPGKLAPGLISQPRLVGTYTPRDRSQEYQWLHQHRDEYANQWVALDGNRLLGNGFDLKEVSRQAKQVEGGDPIFVRVEPSDALPFAGF